MHVRFALYRFKESRTLNTLHFSNVLVITCTLYNVHLLKLVNI